MRASLFESAAVVFAPPLTPGQRLADVDELAQILPGWTGRFEQLTRGRFEGWLKVARSSQSMAHLASSNQALRVRGRESVGILTIGLVLPQAENSLWQGRRLLPGQIVVRDGQTEVNHVAARSTASLMFAVPESVFRRAMVQETGESPSSWGWRAIQPPPEAFVRLRTSLLRFLSSASESGRASDEMESECIVAAIAALIPARRQDRVPSAARVKLVRRAEAVMRDRLREPLSKFDLCRELGVSGRTLRLAFHSQFGMGPAAYFQTLRLNAARSALKQSRRDEVSVAAVVRAYGFTHLGKFAGYYRRLFHELPSHTCQRR